MKLVMSTTVAGVVLALLATAEAQNKDYATVRRECQAEVHHFGAMKRNYRTDRYNPDGTTEFNAVRECIKAAGYVPRLPPR
jgi:hypothetical protein